MIVSSAPTYSSSVNIFFFFGLDFGGSINAVEFTLDDAVTTT
jgi:hypothetical protein